MAIDFPASPTEGDLFQSNKVLYEYYNGVWQARLRGTARPFNYIVNPSFQVSLENGNASSTAVMFYPADQWHIQVSGYTGTGFRGSPAVTPMGSRYRLTMTVGTAAPALPLGYWGFVQYIEGARIAAFQFGTGLAKPIVLRFWFKGPAGTWGGSIRNGNSTRGYAYAFTVTALEANTWVERVVAIPPDMAGTWVKDTNSGMAVWFTFVCGTASLAAAPGTWLNQNVVAPNTLSNGFAAVNTFEVADVGLYLDPDATGKAPPWEGLSERQERTDCARYYQRMNNGQGIAYTTADSPNRFGSINMGAMRATPAATIVPTLQTSDGFANVTMNSFIASPSNTGMFEHNCSSALGHGIGRAAILSTGAIAQNARM